MAAVRTCPVCEKPVPPRPGNAAFPFCSDRCRFVDLGKWLGEEYRIPGARLGDGAGPAAPRDEEEDDA